MNTIINITIRRLIERYVSFYDFNKPDYLNTIRIDDVVKDLELLICQLKQQEKKEINNN